MIPVNMKNQKHADNTQSCYHGDKCKVRHCLNNKGLLLIHLILATDDVTVKY